MTTACTGHFQSKNPTALGLSAHFVPLDFDGDGKADILWQNTNGEPAIWFMNGTTQVGGGPLTVANSTTPLNPGPNWQIVGSADFNGDRKADILWQNADGEPAIWFMDGTTRIGGGPLTVANSTTPLNPGPGWKIVGTGDFNGDGKTDILWQNADGEPAIWFMDGTTQIGGGVLTNGSSTTALNPGANWKIVGTADFNGDGKTDILWQNENGEPAIWFMDGTTQIGGGVLTNGSSTTALNPGPTWHVVGTADFNADGIADILWQNVDGQPAIWLINGTTVIDSGQITAGGSTVAINPGTTWQIAGIGDFNGDGTAGILWRNTDGEIAIWQVDRTTITGSGKVTNASSTTALDPGASWVMPQTPPPPPTGLTVSATGDSSIGVSWKSGGGFTSSYLVNLGSSCTGGIQTTAPSYSFTDLAPNSSYTVAVCAVKFSGEQGASVIGSATTFPSSKACTAGNGSGTQYWAGSGYGACQISSCNSGHVLFGNTCNASSQPCSSADGSGVQYFSGGSYGTCQISSCNSGYVLFGNTCNASSQPCSSANGNGTQPFSGGSYGACQVVSCNSGFTLSGGACVPVQESADIALNALRFSTVMGDFYAPSFIDNGPGFNPRYDMWTTVGDRIVFFSSNDGINWSGGQPVLTAIAGSWEDDSEGRPFVAGYPTGLSNPVVVAYATPGWLYTMYYTAGPANNTATRGGIGVAVSNDGQNWQRVGVLRSHPGGHTFMIAAMMIGTKRYIYYQDWEDPAQGSVLWVAEDTGDGITFTGDRLLTDLPAQTMPLVYDTATNSCWMAVFDQGWPASGPGGFDVFAESDCFNTLGTKVATVNANTTGMQTNFFPDVVQRTCLGTRSNSGASPFELMFSEGNSWAAWQPIAVTITPPGLPVLSQ